MLGLSLVLVVLVLSYILLNPVNAIKHSDGHFYRASCDDNLDRLSELRRISIKIIGGLPTSPRKMFVLWKLGRCVFVERPIQAQKPYLALTVDKGRELEICLDYSDRNTLLYVLIHELAHVMSFTTGHTKEFYRNVDRLLTSAKEQGIYTGSPRKNVTFCGSHIDVD